MTAAPKANKLKAYSLYAYADVNYAFNADTLGRRGKAEADLAGVRTVASFKQQLGAPPA